MLGRLEPAIHWVPNPEAWDPDAGDQRDASFYEVFTHRFVRRAEKPNGKLFGESYRELSWKPSYSLSCFGGFGYEFVTYSPSVIEEVRPNELSPSVRPSSQSFDRIPSPAPLENSSSRRNNDGWQYSRPFTLPAQNLARFLPGHAAVTAPNLEARIAEEAAINSRQQALDKASNLKRLNAVDIPSVR